MAGKLNEKIILQVLEWSYGKAITGAGVLGSAYNLAEDYQKRSGSNREAVESLIAWQTAKCATTGFVTGIGGVITLPFAIPANIASVLLFQLQMIQAIAIIGGHDPRSDQVRSLAFVCLTGSAATDLLKGLGVRVGEKTALIALEAISAQVATKVNQLVGLRLLTRFGKRGVINFSKAVPVVGGIVCGSVDAVTTRIIGKTAAKYFVGV
ncbi:MAG: EcsC family protein [Bacteroidota bacterium]|nr:EcsC family protein [Bacteroidota bacterium]